MKNIIKRISICLLLITQSLEASALEKQVKLTGASASFKYSELSPGETVTVYGVSKGNSSNPVKISVYGPKGIKVSASAAKVSRSIDSTLGNSRAFYPLSVNTDKQLDAYDNQCVDFSLGDALSEEEPEFDPSSIVSIWDPLCDQYSASDLTELGAALADTYGGVWDNGRVCGYIVYVYRSGAGDGELPPDPSPARLRARSGTQDLTIATSEFGALLNKNACGASSDRYIIKVKVKLPQEIPSSGYFRVRLFETKHYGASEATIKPVSDGKYAPQPLLLMNYLGFCGQRLNVVKWRKDKPISVATGKVYDLIQYRDMVLTRTPFGSYLTGGQGTVELFDRNGGYGACFQLERTRQRVNGYPE